MSFKRLEYPQPLVHNDYLLPKARDEEAVPCSWYHLQDFLEYLGPFKYGQIVSLDGSPNCYSCSYSLLLEYPQSLIHFNYVFPKTRINKAMPCSKFHLPDFLESFEILKIW